MVVDGKVQQREEEDLEWTEVEEVDHEVAAREEVVDRVEVPWAEAEEEEVMRQLIRILNERELCYRLNQATLHRTYLYV